MAERLLSTEDLARLEGLGLGVLAVSETLGPRRGVEAEERAGWYVGLDISMSGCSTLAITKGSAGGGMGSMP